MGKHLISRIPDLLLLTTQPMCPVIPYAGYWVCPPSSTAGLPLCPSTRSLLLWYTWNTWNGKLTLLIAGDGQKLIPLTPAVAWIVRGEPPDPEGRGKPHSPGMSD
jgi:hypothetical protein